MYEKFRNDYLLEIMGLPEETVKFAVKALDRVASKYEIAQRELGLAVYGEDLPDAAKMYLVVKKMAGLSDGTLNNYKLILERFFRMVRKPPERVEPNDIRMFLYVYQKERGISSRTLDKYREYIAWFFAWANSEGYISRDPAKTISAIKYEIKPRVALSQVELEYLRASCETPRESAIIEMLYSTGCRVSELAALKKSDVDWYEKSVHLYGKGRKHRTSFINAKAEVALIRYLDSRNDDSDFLFVSSRRPYKNLKKEGIEKIVRTIAHRSSCKTDKTITPHVLRHTTATTALQSGMPIADISKLLGHEKIDTTMIYAESSLADVKAGHRKHIV